MLVFLLKCLLSLYVPCAPCTELFKKQKTNTNYLDPQGGKKDKDLKSSGTEAIGERRTRLLQRREPWRVCPDSSIHQTLSSDFTWGLLLPLLLYESLGPSNLFTFLQSTQQINLSCWKRTSVEAKLLWNFSKEESKQNKTRWEERCFPLD